MEGGLEPYRAHSMKAQPSPGSFELDPGSLRIPVYGIARVYLIQVHVEYLKESVFELLRHLERKILFALLWLLSVRLRRIQL